VNVEQAKIKNIIDIAWDFSAMTRVFKSGSSIDIKIKLAEVLPEIASAKNEQDFKELHNKFCLWFAKKIKTAKHKKNGTTEASYGEGAKVLNVALKVYVYYCQLPDPKTAQRTAKLLHAAIDTEMLKYLKKYDKTMPASEAKVDKDTYGTLQKLVCKDIRDCFSNRITPVQWDDIMWRKLNSKDEMVKFYFGCFRRG
jgi:hypothetical protein